MALCETRHPVRLEVFDEQGRIVAEEEVVGREIMLDVSGWAAGSYVVRTPNGACSPARFVKQ